MERRAVDLRRQPPMLNGGGGGEKTLPETLRAVYCVCPELELTAETQPRRGCIQGGSLGSNKDHFCFQEAIEFQDPHTHVKNSPWKQSFDVTPMETVVGWALSPGRSIA